MAGLFGSTSQSQSQPNYTTIQIQTSTAGIPITLLWGTNKLAANLLWEGDFRRIQSKSGKGGKGGGGKGGSGTVTYYAGVIMGLCEGPVQGINAVYSNNSVVTLSSLALGLWNGNSDQPIPPYWAALHPTDSLAYADTAYVGSIAYNLGSAATLPAVNFEVVGQLAGSVPPGGGIDRSHDANFADIIYDFIGNPRYGVDPTLLPYVGGPYLEDYKLYCAAQTLIGSPMLDSQDQALTVLQRWATITNTWIFWSGTHLKFIPLSTESVSDGGVTWNPKIAPVYDLSYDDYVFESTSGDADPISFERIDPRDGYNRVEVDGLDRNNQYNSSPQYYEDLASVQDYGSLQSQSVSANEICIPSVTQTIANLIGKRMLAIRNTYSFKLGYHYILLEPGDIVTLTDPNLGLNRFPVRITEIGEDDKGNLDIKAEEFAPGSGVPAVFAVQGGTTNPMPDQYADPGNVNEPLIFEPPVSATGGVPEVWIGASGGPNWGGAVVYASVDNVNYVGLGTLDVPTAQGVLTADLPSHADPDNSNTLSIDMAISGVPLSTGTTNADADALTTASIIDSEALSYGTVHSTGATTYNLTYLRRGIYRTGASAHTAGAVFSRVDPTAVLQITLPQQWVGHTIYVKFTSFNTFGGNQQGIDEVTAYTYTPIGVAYSIAPPTGPNLAGSMYTQTDGTVITSMTLSWFASPGPALGGYEVQFSQDSGSTWTALDQTVGPGALSVILSPALSATNYQARVRAISQNGLAMSSWATSAVTVSPTIPAGGTVSLPATPTGFAVVSGASQVNLSWAANAIGDHVLGYKIYRAPGLSAGFGAATNIATVNALNYADTGLISGTPYTYFLSAVNAAGEGGHTAGVNSTVLTLQTKFTPYFSLHGRTVNPGEILFSLPIDFPTQFTANFGASRGDVDEIAATSTVVMNVRQNGSTIGTITYPAGATGRNVATFATVGGVAINFATGDELSVVASASPDPTFQGFNFSLEGLR